MTQPPRRGGGWSDADREREHELLARLATLDEDDPARARLLRGLEGFEPVVYAPDWTALADAHRVGA